MAWTLSFKASVVKELSALPKIEQMRIKEMLAGILADPRASGKPLKGDKGDLWRYRAGRYRVVCDLRGNELLVLVVRVAHRKDVYRD